LADKLPTLLIYELEKTVEDSIPLSHLSRGLRLVVPYNFISYFLPKLFSTTKTTEKEIAFLLFQDSLTARLFFNFVNLLSSSYISASNSKAMFVGFLIATKTSL